MTETALGGRPCPSCGSPDGWQVNARGDAWCRPCEARRQREAFPRPATAPGPGPGAPRPVEIARQASLGLSETEATRRSTP